MIDSLRSHFTALKEEALFYLFSQLFIILGFIHFHEKEGI